MPQKKKSTIVKKELVGGAVESSEVFAERTDRDITKLLRVVSVIRTPKSLIARIALQTKAALYALEIDEPTAIAVANVFKDHRAKLGANVPATPPPQWPSENEGKPVDIG
jgi:hypothetical protein